MAGYLFVASRDPSRSPDLDRFLALVVQTARKASVTLLLVGSGVLLARGKAGARWLDPLKAAGVEVLVDEHALREPHRLHPIRAPLAVGERLSAGSIRLVRLHLRDELARREEPRARGTERD